MTIFVLAMLSPEGVWFGNIPVRPPEAVDGTSKTPPIIGQPCDVTPIELTEDSYNAAKERGEWLVIGIEAPDIPLVDIFGGDR